MLIGIQWDMIPCQFCVGLKMRDHQDGSCNGEDDKLPSGKRLHSHGIDGP